MEDNMGEKLLPLPPAGLEKIASVHLTPFYLYDERGIREVARFFNRSFSWSPGFKNYYAVKACPNPVILAVLKEEGFGVDCSSGPELTLAQKTGFSGDEIMFTSNDTPPREFAIASGLGALINLDDISHLDTLETEAGIPEMISFRYNPGDLRSGNNFIGEPVQAKYGVPRDLIVEAYRKAAGRGAKRFGLHTMIASNELDNDYFVETARMLFELAVKIKDEAGIRIELINMGGGLGIPYRPGEKPVDLDLISGEVRNLYNELLCRNGLDPVSLVFECGRFITGPHGYLVSRVRHVTRKYKNFAGLDASMADLMRPGMYGAYHHITVVGKEDRPLDNLYDVTGSLCENIDKFAIDRPLPGLVPGDLLVIHDTGAHGYAMGFNYNGKLRPAELLLKEDGSVELIRRAETENEYFSTLRFHGARFSL